MNSLIAAVLCAVLSYSLAAEKHDEKIIQDIKLEKIESMRTKLIKSGDFDAFNRYLNVQKALKAFKQPADQIALNLEMYMDATYAWDIAIGKPAQPFRVLFSTMDAALWVPDYSCLHQKVACSDQCKFFSNTAICSYLKDCVASGCCNEEETTEIRPPPSGCEGKRLFESSQSQTFHSLNNDKTRFDLSPSKDNAISGFVGYDGVQLFGMNVLQYVCLVDKLGSFFHFVNADGVMGFGFPKMDMTSHILFRPFILNAAAQHQTYDTFSVYMNEYGGVGVSIGGISNIWFTGDIAWMNVPKGPMWQMAVDRIWLGGNNFVSTGGVAVSSTAHDHIAAPADVVQKIANTLGVTGFDPQMQMYTVVCGAPLQQIAIVMGGNLFTLSYHDYVVQVGPKCYLAFRALPAGQPYSYIFGAPFFRAYYHVYQFNYFSADTSRIGLAKSRQPYVQHDADHQ